ncbi:5-methyltetrahydrofolate--homocysteine methyltransferase [Clostridia bacterium]|nr:5-methyltetrahydrofolate--homocysteine methyltransferase [Clostridia bacterium]
MSFFNRRLYFDGGMGDLLAQSLYPDAQSAHIAYAAAGADVITTNTFANTSNVAQAVELAKATGKLVALDIGPTGQLLEPMGNLSFEDAYKLFADVVKQGGGADFILIETMADSYELKAAVLAAKENYDLPVAATVTLDRNGKLLTGADIRGVAALLEGLRVDALGLNCSFGPRGLVKFVKEVMEVTSLPVLVQPNAGMPDAQGRHTESPEDFAAAMLEIAELGVQMLGGCCGTTPQHIRKMIEKTKHVPYTAPARKSFSIASSGCATVEIGKRPLVIGERLNPTGKKLLKAAIVDGDAAFIQREAVNQTGADVLDVNTGVPGIDEAAALTMAVRAVQSVSSAVLQLDSADPVALNAALRIYNGKAIINSVNGKQESMSAVFPLVQRYGGVVVVLPLTEKGVPETADQRVAIAEAIAKHAATYGIDKKDLLIDGLVLSVSANPREAKITLETVEKLHNLGYNTVLGVSNISFGLPNRDELNAAFLTLALGRGLSAAIVNPGSAAIRRAFDASDALWGHDAGFERWISHYAEVETTPKTRSADSLKDLIKSGVAADCGAAARELIAKGNQPLEIIDAQIIPALNEVGAEFEAGRAFLPQLLRTADAAQAAFDVLREHMPPQSAFKDTVVIATVRGDVHDIGKNIARTLMRNYGYNVIDLGKDVPPQTVVSAAREHNADYVGLSALMTTTVPAMGETIAAIRAAGLNCRVFVSGAVMTEEYAELVKADRYVKDAMDAMRYMESYK